MKQQNVELAKKKVEAIKRMRVMGLMPSVIKDFENNDVVYYSERVGVPGILYWISNKPEWEDFIKQFDVDYNTLVYHAELSYLEFGTCLSLFYVSDYKSEWIRDVADLRKGYACCYVWNIDDDLCSEFGSIMFKPANGGILRTA